MSTLLRAPRRIFVRLPNWVGDVVMSTPVLRALRSSWPEAELVVEGPRVVADLIAPLPSVDRYLVERGRDVVALALRAGELAALDCDCALILPDSFRTAISPFLARIPRRVGYARDLARRTLLSHALPPPMQNGKRLPISMIERYLVLARTLGCVDPEPGLDIAVVAEHQKQVQARLLANGIPGDRPFCVVTPGAAFGSSKLWPPEHFARACHRIHERYGLVPVLAPGPAEIEIAGQIASALGPGTISLADPPTTLGELAALIERARLLLTNDTGPRQMAVALGVPVITLMGPTDPRHTAHLLELQRVLREPVECSPCHLKVCPIDHRCMTGLSPDRVVSAAGELLARERRT